MNKNNCEKWLKISSGARKVMGLVMLAVYCAVGIIYCPYKITMTIVAVVYFLSVLFNNLMKKRCEEV